MCRLRLTRHLGLVTRHTPPKDRHKTVLGVTEAGIALIQRHSTQSAAIFALIEAEFGAERVEPLLDLLENLQRLDLRPDIGKPDIRR
jgi:DNA-binding MarR family transcriptional regulator